MKNYFQTLQIAETLPGIVHWLIGTLMCFIAITLENASYIERGEVLGPLLFCSLGGIVLIIASRLLMLMLPRPYAWLAQKITGAVSAN
ncbi:MAG: hypothetical protein FD173_936 [Gallionellaceae bacterium]|nr:MAG: hypothetical protein FD173_936 [Gallionellaceae bacterium]